jgi:hypothetical protein
MQRQQVELYLDTEVQEENKELEFKATTLRIEFEAITTLKNHLDNAEATRMTKKSKFKATTLRIFLIV